MIWSSRLLKPSSGTAILIRTGNPVYGIPNCCRATLIERLGDTRIGRGRRAGTSRSRRSRSVINLDARAVGLDSTDIDIGVSNTGLSEFAGPFEKPTSI